jgi:hypothetical protein
MKPSRYPRWSMYLAGFAAFVFLASLFALMLVPASDPVSVLERVLWGALAVAFLALLPLFFLRLKDMVIRLGEMPREENAGLRRQEPKAPSQREGDNRDDGA